MIHPSLNFLNLEKLYGGTLEQDFVWSPIRSQFNVWCYETLRKRASSIVSSMNRCECDLVLWGRGEPQNIAATKIGGTPVWSSKKKRPDKLDYFGQVCLLDTPNVLQHIEGDVVSIWGDAEFPYGVIRAYPLDSRELVVIDATLVESVEHKEPFFGAIYRTHDFCDFEAARLVEIEVSGESGPRGFRCLPWKGTKGGGVASVDRNRSKKGFLFQIMSIQAQPEQSYPWVNVVEPLEISGCSPSGYASAAQQVPIGDMGFLSFFSDKGRINVSLEV